MSLTNLWLNSRNLLEDKSIRQIIAFAGDAGDDQLRDGSAKSDEFREFLAHIPSDILMRYVNQCLQNSFPGSGLVLQDLVNQIGRRLGFNVTNGRYQGVRNQIGCDGIWILTNGHTLIVEVKTTDVYQIPLDTLAKYRRQLIEQNKCTEDTSSILIVLGRDDRDTRDLEAQIRGSHHARNIRLISIEAFGQLMALKEKIGDLQIIERISQILIPREYTKLDEIVSLIFFTADDIKQEVVETEHNEGSRSIDDSSIPATFYEACIDRIQVHSGQSLIKRSRVSYSTPDDSLRLVCVVSKIYERQGAPQYWFAFHPYQKQYLEGVETAFIALGCGSAENVLLIPIRDFVNWLDQMNVTEKDNRFYWHVNIRQENKRLFLLRKKGAARIDLSPYNLINGN
jgi:hypothetical protein